MIAEILVFLTTFLVVYFLYTYKSVLDFFKGRGVKCLPGVPIFGNTLQSSFTKRHLFYDIDEVYKTFPDERYVGYIEGTKPILIIRDPELVKKITLKDFDHFVDHKEFFSEDIDPLFGGSLFMMKGDKWRDMRMTLSPAFTSSKIKQMMPFMLEVAHNAVEHLKENPSQNTDVEDLVRRYTNDVIASSAFGLQVNSYKDKSNDFYKSGRNVFTFNIWQRIFVTIYALFPKIITIISKKLGITLFPKPMNQFFKHLVISTMEYREKNHVERPDMIQLLMEASKGKLKASSSSKADTDIVGIAGEEVLKPQGSLRKWSQSDLAAQAFLFFAAGYESSASVLIMCIHELALRPHIQEKLYEEIRTFKEEHGNITHDTIHQMKYLDGVLNETLRKWSPAIILDRVCVKPYELPPPREGVKPYIIKPGDIVYNAINSIQMDAKYFPEPEVFDPERFSDENKQKIKPFTYLPFGSGPRNCIGVRFALIELKVLLYSLVLNYKIVKTNKTSEPIRLAPADFSIKAIGDTWVKFEPRNE